MKKDRYYRTTNLNLATFLFAKEQQISGINPVNEKQKEFAFINSGYLEELVWIWKFGDRDDDRLMVLIPRYEQARNELLDRLKD